MLNHQDISEGWKLWNRFSNDNQIKDLPPLARLIAGIRKESQNEDELLNKAYSLCEENIEIIKYEYNKWKGQAIFDATSVFSLEGIGGDLINKYGVSFVEYIKIIAKQAKRTNHPEQYNQCINTNLQQSNCDDAIIIERMKALEGYTNPGNSSIYPRPLSVDKITRNRLDHEESANKVKSRKIISVDTHPECYSFFTRRMGLSLDGEIKISGPLFMNTYLSRPFNWLVSIDLDTQEIGSIKSISTVSYSIHEITRQDFRDYKLRLLIESTFNEPGIKYQNEHNFLLYKHPLPIGEYQEVTIDLHPNQWVSIEGNQELAYGIKCINSNPYEIMQRSKKRFIFALETEPNGCIHGLSMNLPYITL